MRAHAPRHLGALHRLIRRASGSAALRAQEHYSERDAERTDHGVALVTSAHALVESFSGVDSRKIGFGFVVYPYRDALVRDRLTEGHYSLPPFLIKTKAFEPECEFRVFVQTKNPTDSCDLDVDLNKLVHEIRISPLAPRWVDDAVRATLDPICDRLGIPKVADRERNLRE